MSLHPQYAQRILDGTKRVEFRKRRIADDVTHIVVYATAPVSAVVGAFTVLDQHSLSPHALWLHFEDVAGISRSDFMTYFVGREAGVGIEVGNTWRAHPPMCLRESFGIAHPPQSFQYLANDTATLALKSMDEQQTSYRDEQPSSRGPLRGNEPTNWRTPTDRCSSRTM